MHYTVRVTLVIAGVVGFGAVAPAAARERAQPNLMEVVVGSGPFSGTYKPPKTEVICMHAKQQKMYTAAFKDFAPKSAKALSEAGINVTNPDVATAGKHADIRIAFGDPAKKQTVYSAEGVPVTMKAVGNGAEIVFDGTTKEGVQLRVTAKCQDVEQM